MSELVKALSLIRVIPDYPAPGILFQDITPILADGPAFRAITCELAKEISAPIVIAGVEARGFILAAAMASLSGTGFVPIRKKGKLPFHTHSRSYGLEYGSDELEIHIDAFPNGGKVILVDDVLATGGTLLAAIELIEEAGGEVIEIRLLNEIAELGGREKIHKLYPSIEIISLI
jgi:adenine phosphoribosyltransferase